MSENNFDQHIKNQIEGFQIDFDKSNWDAFNSRLDREFGAETTTSEDLSFDNEISKKLTSQKATYNASHWAQLLERLEVEDSIKNRLISLTIMEVTAIFLVILAIWNWKGAEYFNKQKENNAANIPVAAVIHENLNTESESSFNALLEQEKTNTIVPTENATSSVDATSINDLVDDVKVSEKIRSEINTSINNSGRSVTFVESNHTSYNNEVQSIISTNTSNNKVQSGSNDLLLSKKKTDVFNGNLLAGSESQKVDATLRHQSEETSVSMLGNNQYVSLNQEESLNPMHVLIDIKKSERKRFQLAAGLVGSLDAYLIRSPDDPVYPYPSYYTDSKGLTGGGIFSARSKSVEIEFGLLYSSVEYAPRKINENYSSRGRYYTTSLENILFNVISVPVNIKLHFNMNPKSSFYLSLGSSYNAIINSNFNITNTEIAAPLNPVADPFEKEPDLNKKPQIPGALEGGSLLENTFITADVGIGYQHAISSRVNLFVQPTLHTHFSGGIGPNGDRLHKISLFAGAKYNLN